MQTAIRRHIAYRSVQTSMRTTAVYLLAENLYLFFLPSYPLSCVHIRVARRFYEARRHAHFPANRKHIMGIHDGLYLPLHTKMANS